jgi:hypothetical protein
MMKLIEFMRQIQQAPLELADHQFVAGAIRKSSTDFVFEEFLPPFEVNDEVGFRH